MEVLNITAAEYHQYDAVSHHGMRCFEQDGALVYHARYIERSLEKVDTDAMRLGRIFHLAMEKQDKWKEAVYLVPESLEDDEFLEEIAEQCRGRSKASFEPGTPISLKVPGHRLYMEAHQLKAARLGQEWVTPKDIATVLGQIMAVYENPECLQYVNHGRHDAAEVACIAEDFETGLMKKALIDLLLDDVIVDYKVTRFRTAKKYVWDAYNRGYQYQGDHYLDVTGREKFCQIVVTSEPPFEANVFVLPEAKRKLARERNRATLAAIWQCMQLESWHSPNWGAELPLDPDCELFKDRIPIYHPDRA